MTEFVIKSKVRVFDGHLIRFSHLSRETKTTMTCAVYIPMTISSNGSEATSSFPTLLYLSGLTCTDENVCQKSGVFRYLSEAKIGFISPDTSPRGAGVPGEKDSWDLGEGAGFYLDATEPAWATNYRMYSYVTVELLEIVKQHFAELDLTNLGIFGHSMGGHGALTLALRNKHLFKSVSAFAPICNPSKAPVGHKVFKAYLGSDESTWTQYDATCLVATATAGRYDDILIDVGTADSFYNSGALMPETFQSACNAAGQKVTLRIHEGFDHVYYFVSTFMEHHVKFHAQRLKK